MREVFLTLFIIFELFIYSLIRKFTKLFPPDFLKKLYNTKYLLITIPLIIVSSIIIYSNLHNEYNEDIDKIISFINNTQQEKGNPISRSQINFTVKELNYNLDDINYEKYNLNYILNDINTTYKIYDIENKGFYYFPEKDKVSRFPIKHKNFSEYKISSKSKNTIDTCIFFTAILISYFIVRVLYLRSYNRCKTETEKIVEVTPATEVIDSTAVAQTASAGVFKLQIGKGENINLNIPLSTFTQQVTQPSPVAAEEEIEKKEIEEEIEKKAGKKVLKFYFSIFFSYFTSLFLTGQLIKYFKFVKNSLLNSTRIDSPDDRIYFNYFNILAVTVTLITLFAILAIFLNFIKLTISFIIIILLIGIMISIPFISPNANNDYIYSSFFILSYIFSLVINYNFIKTTITKLPEAYRLLQTDGKIDPAKLTLLWTIIVFILGVVFNIKPVK